MVCVSFVENVLDDIIMLDNVWLTDMLGHMM